MDEFLEKGKAILIKNGKATAKELLVEALEPALQKLVADTTTPFDDIAYLAIKDPLKKALMDVIEKL